MELEDQRTPHFETLRDRSGIRNWLDQTVCGHHVIFHHVPKCGGTSLTRALMKRYLTSFVSLKPLEPIYDTLQILHPNADQQEILTRTIELRWKLLALYASRDVKLIYGHLPFNRPIYDFFQDRYKFITILRDPVSFFISFYFWNLVERPTSRWEVDRDVEKFLDTERAQVWGEFFPRFFCGHHVPSGEMTQDVINAAKDNICNFDVIGLLEDLEGFEKRLSIAVGKRIHIGHSNKGRRSDHNKDKLITAQVKRKILKISASNIDFYNFARQQASV